MAQCTWMAPLSGYGIWPFITFLKVIWFADHIWCKYCSSLSLLPCWVHTQQQWDTHWSASPFLVFIYATQGITYFRFLFPCNPIPCDQIVNGSAAVFEYWRIKWIKADRNESVIKRNMRAIIILCRMYGCSHFMQSEECK